MSLMDALLLDPLATDVWVGLRPDGALGSGTEDDPYDGSVVATATVDIYSITCTLQDSTYVATATTTTNHGFHAGDPVLISGVTGSGAFFYNGTFLVASVTSNTAFTYNLVGNPGGSASGTGMTCQIDPYRFDSVMRSLVPASGFALHLGPGVFQTKGYCPTSLASWVPRTQMKMFGSGMEVTVLQLVGAFLDNNTNDYTAIAGPYNNYLDGFEAADFTVDCNIAGQPSSQVACGAVAVVGTHIRLRRIRAINFGTQTSPTQTECFVLGITGVYQSGTPGEACVIEGCIVEQPGLNSALEVSCMYINSRDANVSGEAPAMVYHRGCAIRNSHVNCEYRNNPVPILSIAWSGTGSVFNVTTSVPHGHATNDWVLISGALVEGSPFNSFNGSYQITRVSDYEFQYTPNPSQPNDASPSGAMRIGAFPSQMIQITQIEYTLTSPSLITITTATAHFLVPECTVLIGGVGLGALNGAFQVDSHSFYDNPILSPTQFTLQFSEPPGAPDQTPVALSGHERIGVSFHGGGADAGTAAVFEGNRLINCGPAVYHDTWNSRDQIIRNSYFRVVSQGTSHNLSSAGVSVTNSGIPLSSLSGNGSIATAMTPLPHGLGVTDRVIIAGVTGGDAGLYNGSFQVTYSDGDKTFKYQMTGSPVGQPSGTPTFLLGGSAPGAQQKILGARSPSAAALTFDSHTGLVTATVDTGYFPAGHGMAIGETVYISKADPTNYNGYFVITAVPSADTFNFLLPTNPGGPSSSGYYGRLTTGGIITEEANLIELAPAWSSYFANVGVELGFGTAPPPALFPRLLMRRNTIKRADGLPERTSDPTPNPTLAAFVQAFATLAAQENVFDLTVAQPLQFEYGASAAFFANQTPGGELVPGFNVGTQTAADELSTDVMDAAVLAF